MNDKFKDNNLKNKLFLLIHYIFFLKIKLTGKNADSFIYLLGTIKIIRFIRFIDWILLNSWKRSLEKQQVAQTRTKRRKENIAMATYPVPCIAPIEIREWSDEWSQA